MRFATYSAGVCFRYHSPRILVGVAINRCCSRISIGSINELGEGGRFCVDDEEFFVATAQDAVDIDLSALDPDYGAGASIDSVAFGASTVAKHNDDLFVVLGPDERFESSDPVCQGIHVGLLWHPTKHPAFLSSEPSHRDDDKVGFHLENVESEFEGMPWRFKFVGTTPEVSSKEQGGGLSHDILQVHANAHGRMSQAGDVALEEAILALQCPCLVNGVQKAFSIVGDRFTLSVHDDD